MEYMTWVFKVSYHGVKLPGTAYSPVTRNIRMMGYSSVHILDGRKTSDLVMQVLLKRDSLDSLFEESELEQN